MVGFVTCCHEDKYLLAQNDRSVRKPFMIAEQPTIIRTREIDDVELRRMLDIASSSGDVDNFFGQFDYYNPGQPFLTLQRGEALLSKCRKLAPDTYAKLRKGTPFYWLAWATFAVHDYETFAFYIDAAVSDDLKAADDAGKDRTTVDTPALHLFRGNLSPEQALLPLTKILRNRITGVIDEYNNRPGHHPTPLTFDDIQGKFLNTAILRGNEQRRTLVTTFISYFLEWDHRADLIELRTEQGTAGPYFIHLFKGCLLFESLLKANPTKSPTNKMLSGILKELKPELQFNAEPDMTIGGSTFQQIVADLRSADSSIYSAIQRAGRIRNTTGHDLGWQVSLTASEFNSLAESVALSCLHAIACLYR
jgi:hypothetical protein